MSVDERHTDTAQTDTSKQTNTHNNNNNKLLAYVATDLSYADCLARLWFALHKR